MLPNKIPFTLVRVVTHRFMRANMAEGWIAEWCTMRGRMSGLQSGWSDSTPKKNNQIINILYFFLTITSYNFNYFVCLLEMGQTIILQAQRVLF